MSLRHLQDKHRKRMLQQLGQKGALQGNAIDRANALGYRGGKRAVSPSSKRPAMVNHPDTFAKWAQAALQMVLGIKVKIDGDIGPVTRDVIKQFQRLEGLTAHGYLDERTIQVLELRTGVRAPRGFAHEPVPHLLRMPRKHVWQPKPKPKKRRKGQSGEVKGAEGAADASAAALKESQTVDGAGPDVDATAGAVDHDVEAAKPGFLQDEAMGAVAAQAFSNDFAQLAAERLDQPDWAGLQGEMHTWWRELGAQDKAEQPRWLHLAAAEARARAETAASRVRRRWWSQHVDGEG